MNTPKQKKKTIQKYKMDFLEKITLSPIEKYTRFNRFPWKLLFHLLLLIFTTIQVLSVVGTRTSNARAQHQVFKYVLLGSTDEVDTIPFNNFSDFKQHLHDITDNLNNLNSFLFQHVNLSKATFKLSVYYIELEKTNHSSNRNSQFDVNLDDGIPLDFVDIDNSAALKNMTNSLNQLTFSGDNIMTTMRYGDARNSYFCNKWSIRIDYNFETFSRIVANFDSASTFCDESPFQEGNKDNFGQSYLLIHFIVLILASISLFLSWKSIYQMAKDYMQYMFLYKNVANIVGKSNPSLQKMSSMSSKDSMEENQEEPMENMLEFKKSWEELSFFDKLKFFDFWFVFSILGNFIQINGSIIAILFLLIKDQLAIFSFHEAIIGFGCMFAWLLMLKYLEYNQNINLMTTTLSNSGSTLAIFLLGVLPFYLGYVFLGQCLFWKTDKFQDTNYSVITLFSLSFGDIVNETFQNTKIGGVLGELFLMTFMLLFYTAVQNVFITIIMDGYEKSKREKKGKKDPDEQNTTQQPMTINSFPNFNKKGSRDLSSENLENLTKKVEEETNKNIANSFMMSGDLSDSKLVSFRHPDKLDSENESKESVEKKEKKMKESFVVSHFKDDDVKQISNQDKIREELGFELKEEQEAEAKIMINQKEKQVENEDDEEEKKDSDQEKGGKITMSINVSKDKDDFKRITIDKVSLDKAQRDSIGSSNLPFSPLKKMPKNDKEKILNKMKLNVGKIEKILENLSNLATEIESIEFTPDDKMYLIENYKENLEEIEKEVKYQINYIK